MFKFLKLLSASIVVLFLLLQPLTYPIGRHSPSPSYTDHRHHETDKEEYDWADFDADHLTGAQILEYFKWDNSSACELRQSFGGVLGGTPPRVDDQTDCCLDAGVVVPSTDCVVYSFGLSNFDQFIANYGCRVFSFDPSTDDPSPYHRDEPKIQFLSMGLSDRNYTSPGGKRYLPLSSFYEKLKEQHGEHLIDFLKIDVYGDEWKVISNLVQSEILSSVKQMAINLYIAPATNANWFYDPIEKYVAKVKLVKSLEDCGFVRFSSKKNPFSHKFLSALRKESYTRFQITWYNVRFYHKE